MPTKARRKRRWKADPGSIYGVMSKLQPLVLDEQIQITMPCMMAYQKFLVGAADEHEFGLMAVAVNVALVYSERDGGDGCAPDLLLGQAALLRSQDRHKKTGIWALDGPGIHEVGVALNIHNEYFSNMQPVTLKALIQEAIRREKNGNGI